MHRIVPIVKKNLLVIHLNGFRKSHRESFVADIERHSMSLPPGFSCIIICSKTTSCTCKERQDLEYLLYAYSAKAIVYVDERQPSPLPKNYNMSYSPPDIGVYLADTREEAEKLLSAGELHKLPS